MTSKTNLKLVSLDGGDIRGLSQLEIMDTIMYRLAWDNKSNELNGSGLPCDHFDLIGGSGTGGLIAILLGKLRMSMEEVSEEFEDIIEHVFNPKDISASQRTNATRKCIEDILKKKGLPVDLRLTEDKQEGCASFVVASPRTNAKSTVCLRTYPVRNQRPSTITVVEAVLATCATQPEFAPVSSGSGRKAREYIAASGAVNPIHELIVEAHLLFGGDATVASLLSIGVGHPGIISLPQDGGEAAIHKMMRDMMQDCEQRAQEIEERIGRVGIYSRFSVDQVIQNNHAGKLDDLGWITTQTEDYLDRHETGQKLDALAQNFGVENGPITLDQLRHAGGPSAPGQVATTVQKALDILVSDQDNEIIAKLKPKDLEVESQVGTCLEGTRQDILERVRSWEADFEAPNILWINGYPGVGKSAIAATIVEELRSANRLGSSFFFQREKASAMTPSVLWRIVAHDLSRRYPGIRKHLVTTLSMNESCSTTSNVDTLFRELIYEPLTKSDIPAEKLPVIVLDALDECGGVDGRRSDHRKKLMRTLKSWSSLPDGFKLIVTSRRESDIELLFSTVLHHPVEVLAGEDADSSSSSDIRAFLLHELHQLVAQYPSLPSDWPGEKVIAWLIDHARGLFIWIKTVVKLLESGEPRRILRQILSNDVGSMADLYAWILHASFPIPSEDYGRDFCTVLGAIIFTREPLDVANLTHLLSIDSSTMEYICNGLKSVLDCGTIIRIRHQSFVDFLLNSKECPPSFLIDKERERKHLTLCCFNTMKHHLRFNICGLESSYVRNQDVPNLAKRVDECIPLYLSYASRYWASHLVETVPDGNLNDSLQYFMDHQFLWWLETMSLMRQINIGSGMLRSLVSWLRQSNQDDSLATDMQKFVAAFASAMSQSTPHIYISALAFAPRCLEVSKQYLSHYPRTLAIRSGGLQSWPSIQNICTGHQGSVWSVTFSPDGRRIVSGSKDHTIRVWDAETGGTVLGPLQGHRSQVTSVSFSPDGKRIVSGSWDRTIRVWDTETGETVLGPLQGHSESTNSVSFSPDGKRIVSGSHDNTIRVWDVETGETVLGPLQGHSDSINSVSFSPDGKRIASGSSDHTIRVWDAETGETVLGPLQGHSDSINSVSFSPDGKRILSGSLDDTIRVWDAETGETVVGPLDGHHNFIDPVSSSPDGKRIVHGSWDRTIRVWDAETGRTVLGPLQGHSHSVNCVSFSPDGKRIVSGSENHTIRVWYAETGEMLLGPLPGHTSWVKSISFSSDVKRIICGSNNTTQVWDAGMGRRILGPLDGHSGSINCVSFSPDGKRIASGSSDQTIRVWDAGTGESVLGPLQGHSDSINSVSFSPDGKRIVSGSEDHTIWVWDAAMGQTVVNISQSPNPARESLSPFSAQKLLPSGFHNMDYKSNGLLTDIYSNFRKTAKTKDGWIRGPNSELLFWVPPEIRPRLYRLGPILVIDGRKAWTTLDLEHFVHGKEWSRCKDHRVT